MPTERRALDVFIPATVMVARWVREDDGYVLDGSANAMSATTTWANSLISVTKDTVANSFPFVIPEGVTTGAYDVVYYDVASPLVTTRPAYAYRVAIDKDGMGRRDDANLNFK